MGEGDNAGTDREALGCKDYQPQDLGNFHFAAGKGHCVSPCCLDSCYSAIIRGRC